MMKKIEYLLASLFLVSIAGRDLIPLTVLENTIMIFGTALAFVYLIGFWWLHKPSLVNFRTVTLSVLYGLACSSWGFTIIFLTLYLVGDSEMMILSTCITFGVIIIDIVTSIHKVKVMNATLVTRLAAFFVLGALLIAIPQHLRIEYTYRKDQDFLQYYHERSGDFEHFDYLRRSYQEQR